MKFTHAIRELRDLPDNIPVFPLDGALLLPRAELPLNIFEPRYLAMIDDALRGDRTIGMIQTRGLSDASRPDLMQVGCAGRITAFSEAREDRLLITLTGVCRFSVAEELEVATPYRQVRPNFRDFEVDLVSDRGASEVNRPALMKAFRDYLLANDLSADWDEINATSTEVLVNTLSLLAPYPPREKQALLEAPDLKTRADVLVALTEMALSRTPGGKAPNLQ
jgi:Lon protease-like protein